MNDRFGIRPWVALLIGIMLAIGVGMAAYNIGVSHGVAQGGTLAAPPPGTSYVYVSPRPFGFGFGFFPLFFILVWFVVLRGLFWRGPWSGGRHRFEGIPPMFEEWHRRAHAQGEPPRSSEGKA